MARGLKCRVCNQPMYAQEEKYEPQGTTVWYVCRSGVCPQVQRGGQPFREKKFESK
jgi:hypothetical protein